MHDLFTGDLYRKYNLDEYIFTGKNPDLHNPDAYQIEYDTERIGDNYANTTHERLLDEVQIFTRKIANQKNDKINIENQNYEINVPDFTPNELQEYYDGYDHHENSLAFKESLTCRVVTPSTSTSGSHYLYKKDAIITVIGGPVLVSSSSSKTIH